MKNQPKLTTEIYDEISTAYVAKFNKPSENIDDFLKLIREGGKILDAGCGPGTDASYVASKGFNVIGIDLSEKMLEIAKRKSPGICFQKADIRRLNFKPNIFDGIIASFSLIHIFKKDINKTINNFYKLLKPGGVVYIGIQEGKSQEIFLVEPLKSDERIFLNIISVKEIKEILIRARFLVLAEFLRPAENKEEFDFKKFIVIARKSTSN